MSSDTLTPEVLWAQRSSDNDEDKNFVYLTISVPDVPEDKLTLDLQPKSLAYTGYSETLKRKYHVVLDFYGEVVPEKSRINHTAKNVEIKLQKKELKSEYWPRLLQDSKRLHFLKTDFDKWVDEDEQDVASDDFSQFGGMPGMPGMPGMGGGDFGGIDFSKLGGGGDAGLDDDEEEFPEDDDEMPALEAEDEEAAADEKAKPLVEEIVDDVPEAAEAKEEPATASKEEPAAAADESAKA